jgi:stringent starvation protein B
LLGEQQILRYAQNDSMAEPTSTKPYLLRAIYEWCVDNGYTPYVSIVVDARTRVPMEYVRDGEIVLNIGPLATNRLQIGNELIECTARFAGTVRELSIPVSCVAAIYARENGHGMSFETGDQAGAETAAPPAARAPGDDPGPPKPGKPTLRRIK